MSDTHTGVVRAADTIREATGVDRHDVVVVLGSGLGSYADRLVPHASLSYGEVPGFGVPGAVGHSGNVVSTTIGDNRVLLLSGRVHVYEGHDLDTVVLPVRAALAAGCGTVVLTSASGAIAPGLSPGDLTIISDHLNLTGRNPLVGENDRRLGPRFPDMSDVYTPSLRVVARQVGEEEGMTLQEVIYAWWLGPSFETPAEIGMIRALGGDVVGMSTVPEAIAARHMGARVVGLSLVTNLAAGISETPITAEEVMETASLVRPRNESFLDAFLARPELS